MTTEIERLQRLRDTADEIRDLDQRARQLVSQLQAMADRALVGGQTIQQSVADKDGIHKAETLDLVKARAQQVRDAITNGPLARLDEVINL